MNDHSTAERLTCTEQAKLQALQGRVQRFREARSTVFAWLEALDRAEKLSNDIHLLGHDKEAEQIQYAGIDLANKPPREFLRVLARGMS